MSAEGIPVQHQAAIRLALQIATAAAAKDDHLCIRVAGLAPHWELTGAAAYLAQFLMKVVEGTGKDPQTWMREIALIHAEKGI